MKIDFTKVIVEVDFEGHTIEMNLAKQLGNMMKYGSSVLLDIGFEELAKEIYYSNGEVEIPEQYKEPIIQVVKECNFIACVKRTLIGMLK